MKIENVLIVALILFGAYGQFRVARADAATAAALVRADSTAAEAVVAALAQDSTWEVRFASQATDLEQRFSESDDSARARLGAELSAANVRIGLLTETLASAQGEVVSIGNRVGARADSLSLAIETCEGAWEGEIADELLTGSWAFALPSMEHALRYSVEIPGEIVVATCRRRENDRLSQGDASPRVTRA